MVFFDLLYLLQIYQGITSAITLIEFPSVPLFNISMSKMPLYMEIIAGRY